MNHQAARAALAQASGWRKSSYSQAQNDCLEITTDVSGWIGVRDSKLGTFSPVLAFALPEWRATLAAMEASSATPQSARSLLKQRRGPVPDSSPLFRALSRFDLTLRGPVAAGVGGVARLPR